jgi:hypothetical protein
MRAPFFLLAFFIGDFSSMKKLNKKIIYSLATIGLLTSLGAEARPKLSYTYAGAQFFDQDLDDADCSQDGIQIYGSYALNSDIYAIGSFADANSDRCFDSNDFQIGMGYHTLFGADSAIYASLSFEHVSLSGNGDNDTGLVIAGGLRGFVTNELEGRIGLAHHTVYDGDTALNAGVAYWFNPKISATGDLSLGSDVTGIGIGLRINF